MIKEVNKRSIFMKMARERGLSIKEIELVVSSQFSLVRKVMKKGDFEQVRLPFFGRFWVKPTRKKYMDLRKKAQDEGGVKF